MSLGDYGVMPQTFGLLPDDRIPEEKSKDFLFGTENGVVKYELMPDGNWMNSILKSNEVQAGVYFDSMACVSFSLAKVCSMTFNRMIKLGLFSMEQMRWLIDNEYLDSHGEVNFSERALAKWSGTTRFGNSLWRVVDTARTKGLVPNSKWSFPNEQRTPVFDWDDYYKEVPSELNVLGYEFIRMFPFYYEFISTSDRNLLAKGRKYSPAQVTVFAYPPPVNGVYPTTDKVKNHAVASVNDNESEQIRYIADSYEDGYTPGVQFFKKLAWDYSLGDGYIIYFTKPPIKKPMFKKERNSPHVYMIINDKKVKILDMVSLKALMPDGTLIEQVDSLSNYPDNGTAVTLERVTD